MLRYDVMKKRKLIVSRPIKSCRPKWLLISSTVASIVSGWDPLANSWNRENYTAEAVVRTKKWAHSFKFTTEFIPLFFSEITPPQRPS